MKRTRVLLCSLGALLSLSAALGAGALLTGPTRTPVRLTDGCVRYWPISQIWLCGDSVYEIQSGQKMFAGKITDMRPTPQAPTVSPETKREK